VDLLAKAEGVIAVASPSNALQMLPSARRASRMVQRNLLVYKHTWMVIFSGFFEPLFYLLSIGIGLGTMVPDVAGVSYTAFVAPGLLASSCMNGAITDGMFNIFFKLHFQKTYDGILATPMRVPDMAFGEMLWATTRGSIYAAGFLVVVLALGELHGPRILLSSTAVLAFPAALVIALSFSSMAICLTSFLRRPEDFDLVMGLLVTPMFLFSGIFFPVQQLPGALRWLFEIVPLYHAVALLRQLTTGLVDATIVWHLAYLAGAGTLAFVVAMRRLERALVK
jgi:lipooligosaccharide transport system permease protein